MLRKWSALVNDYRVFGVEAVVAAPLPSVAATSTGTKPVIYGGFLKR